MEYNVSYFDVLNVTPQASDEEVKQAYRKLALRFHPDRNPADRKMNERRFLLINEAYAQLKTREKRSRYDRQLRANNDNRPDASWISQIATIFWPAKDSEGQG